MDNFSEQLNSLKNILNSTNNNLKNRAPQSSETKLLNSILNQLEKEHNERVANENRNLKISIIAGTISGLISGLVILVIDLLIS